MADGHVIDFQRPVGDRVIEDRIVSGWIVQAVDDEFFGAGTIDRELVLTDENISGRQRDFAARERRRVNEFSGHRVMYRLAQAARTGVIAIRDHLYRQGLDRHQAEGREQRSGDGVTRKR